MKALLAIVWLSLGTTACLKPCDLQVHGHLACHNWFLREAKLSAKQREQVAAEISDFRRKAAEIEPWPKGDGQDASGEVNFLATFLK
jgi:hypothetical protein